MGYPWLGQEGTGAISGRAACVDVDGGEHPSLPFLVGVTRKVFFLSAGGESPSMTVGGTGRSHRQARTNMWQAAEVPRTPGRDKGCCCTVWGWQEPGCPAAASWWVASHVPALLGSRHRTAFPLSLLRGQPVPTTSSEGRAEVRPGEGAALAGGCWQPSPSCLPLGERQHRRTWCAGQMCTGDEGTPVSRS